MENQENIGIAGAFLHGKRNFCAKKYFPVLSCGRENGRKAEISEDTNKVNQNNRIFEKKSIDKP